MDTPTTTPNENQEPTQVSDPVQPPEVPQPEVSKASSPSVPTAEPDPHPWRPRYFSRLTLVLVLVVIVLASAAYGLYAYMNNANKTSNAHFKIGVMAAFTGGSSNMGFGIMKGVQLAKKQLGASNFDIVQEDSQCDPRVSPNAVKKLITQNVVAIIGDGCSSASLAALSYANNAKIPMISPSASSPMLSIPNDYFFRVIPPDNFQGAFMAQTIYNAGYHNVAVLYTNESYGSGMNTVFYEKFQALGGKVVASESAEPDIIDLSTQIAAIKQAQPQALFIAPNSVLTGVAAINQARAAGLNIPLYAADIMYDKSTIDNTNGAAEGLTVSTFPTGTATFRQAINNEFHSTEQLYAASQAYDIIHLLQIATLGGAKTGEEIKNALPDITFQGVSANIKLDRNGEISDPNYKYDLFQVKNGVMTLLPQ
ncbi:MAG TPA: penicillin-binding protein activator [Candidatus Acidoferrum sp.]|nr:penicillin-binding protein activator [Candidatus Acidoferrum sp.]